MDTGLQRACVALVQAIDSDELVATTYSALCVQSLLHTPHVIPCPACWARQRAIVQVSVETLTCDQCGLHIDMQAPRGPASDPEAIERFRAFLSPSIKAVLGSAIDDDGAMGRLLDAAKTTLLRELKLLRESASNDGVDALWQAIHLMQGQVETFDLRRLSPPSQQAMQAGMTLRRKDLLDEERVRGLRNELSGALQEILHLLDA